MELEAAEKVPCAGAGVTWPFGGQPLNPSAAAEGDTPEQAEVLLTLGRMIMKGLRQLELCNKSNAVSQSSLMKETFRHREHIHGKPRSSHCVARLVADQSDQ